MTDYLVGAFPNWSKFSLRCVFCCLWHLPKDEVSCVKSSYLDLSVIVSGHCFLMFGHSLHSFFSDFVNYIRLLLSSYWFYGLHMFWLGSLSVLSTGMTASMPNVSLNGVSPVGILVVVLYAQRTFCSSSSHAPFAPLSLVLIILSKLLFVTSAWPLAWGCLGDE